MTEPPVRSEPSFDASASGGGRLPAPPAEERFRRPRKLLYVSFFVALAVVILWAGDRYFRGFERRHRVEVERQLSAVADLKAEELTAWRAERLADAAVFSKNPAVTDLVRAFLADPSSQAADDLRAWLSRMQTTYGYDAVYLLDPGFKKLLVFPEGRYQPVSLISDSTTATLRSGSVAFEDFYRNPGSPRIYLKVLAPVLDESAGGTLLAIVALRIDPEKLPLSSARALALVEPVRGDASIPEGRPRHPLPQPAPV